MAHEFFRIVRGSSPTLEDFKPLGTRGKPLRYPEYRREFEEGISVFGDFDHACKMARRNRFRQGRYLVKIVIPDAGSVEFKKTFGEHHYTIYAKPDEVFAVC